MDVWKGTLVLDEADFAQTNEKSELIHYLNCRATGTPVSRQNSKDPSITDTFDNFGITILTQRRGFDDNATESRAIPFYSERSDKKIPVAETDDMLKQGLQLQNELLYLRMRYYREIKIEKATWLEDIADSRLMASLLPLLAIAKFEPTVKETIISSVKEVEQAKIREKANSMDGQLIGYLWEKIKDGLFVYYRPGLFYVLENVEKDETDEIAKEQRTVLNAKILADHFKWNPITIGRVLTSLGIASKGLNNSVKVGKKTYRVIFFEPVMIEKRLKEFVFDYPSKHIFTLVTDTSEVTDSNCGGSQKTLTGYSDTDISQCKTETNNTGVSNVLVHSSVADGKPTYYFYPIPVGEKCSQCENLAVQYVIIHEEKKERLCEACFKRRQQNFTNAHWIRINGENPQ
jgi:hypothetical protein